MSLGDKISGWLPGADDTARQASAGVRGRRLHTLQFRRLRRVSPEALRGSEVLSVKRPSGENDVFLGADELERVYQ